MPRVSAPATPVRAISRRPSGRIRSAKASILSGVPVISKTKLSSVESTTFARKISASCSASIRCGTGARNLEQRQFALDRGAVHRQVLHGMHRDHAGSCASIWSITAGVPRVTMVIRLRWPVWSTSATVRLSML
jgi:hypothetical protein